MRVTIRAAILAVCFLVACASCGRTPTAPRQRCETVSGDSLAPKGTTTTIRWCK